MPHRVAVLDVEQDHIGLAPKLLNTLWLLGVIRVSTAVQTCVDTARRRRMGGREQIAHELGLKQRLAARDGQTAGTVKRPVALVFSQQALDRYARTGPLAHGPRVRVVAIRAAHGAPLGEHHETHTRPVHGAHALDGVDAPERISGLDVPILI